jgi:acyl carrier protein
LRIVDDHDRLLEDGSIGHIQVAGSQLMRGYHRSGEPAAPFCAGWLRTGDLGFLRHGRLVVTGRAKEVIIVNGRKHHAPDLEDLVRAAEGLHARRLAVCGALRAGSAEERVVVFLALRPAARTGARPSWQHALPAISDVVRRLRRATGTAAIDVVPLPAHQFPRTTSGKLKRTHLRARYESGEFAALVAAVHAALAGLSPPAGLDAGPPADRLEQEVIRLCAQALGIDASLVGAHDSVFDLGATSLQLMDFLAAIGDRFRIEPDPAALRERPTPAGLADWLRSKVSLMSTESTGNSRPAIK